MNETTSVTRQCSVELVSDFIVNVYLVGKYNILECLTGKYFDL